jgi:release factor glutamine methyltransferase
MILKEVLDKTTKFFHEKKISQPRLEAEILLSNALHFSSRVELYLKFDLPMNEEDLNKCRELVRRRATGEPVAYLIGEKPFFKSTFKVGPGVLIPRPETELLVEYALNWIQKKSITAPKILDLGSGSGCIGLSLLKELPQATLHSVDISIKAQEWTLLNAHDLNLQDRINFHNMDAQKFLSDPAVYLKDATETFDLIVSNPPYIGESDPMIQAEVKKFEPSEALFAKDDGMFFIKNWSYLIANNFSGYLNKQNLVIFEMGMSQGNLARDCFESLQFFDKVFVEKDLAGLDRFIVGEKNG